MMIAFIVTFPVVFLAIAGLWTWWLATRVEDEEARSASAEEDRLPLPDLRKSTAWQALNADGDEGRGRRAPPSLPPASRGDGPSADPGRPDALLKRIDALRSVAPDRPTHRLEYADAFGEITARDVHVWRVYQDGGGCIYLECFCFLRMAPRTFRADRVLALLDLVTSIAIANPWDYFAAWPGLVSTARRPDPPRVETSADHDWVMARARAGLRGLIWLAAADRVISSEEEAVMLAWVGFRAQPTRGPARPWSRTAALAWIRVERVTFTEASGGLSQMGKAESERFVEIVEDLMLADGEKCRLEESRARRLVALLPAR